MNYTLLSLFLVKISYNNPKIIENIFPIASSDNKSIFLQERINYLLIWSLIVLKTSTTLHKLPLIPYKLKT